MSTFDIPAAKLEIAARNALRHESGLPALSMAVELRRLYRGHRQREWDEYLQSNSRLFSRTLRLAVDRHRRRNGYAVDWRPNSITGMGLQACVFGMFKRRFERERLRTQN